MIVRFYWLKPQGTLPRESSLDLPANVPDDFVLHPIIIPGDLTSGGRHKQERVLNFNLKLFNSETDAVISSGDEIELLMNGPVNLLLPDKELLDLQFTLNRLAALCAATGFPDDFYNDEDEDPEESAAVIVTPPGAEEEGEEGRGRYFRSSCHRFDPSSFCEAILEVT